MCFPSACPAQTSPTTRAFSTTRRSADGPRCAAWACPESAAACTTLSPDAGDCPASTSCYGIQSTNPFGPENFVVRSSDGGAGWVHAGPDWTTSVLNDIACPAALTCFIAGSRGTIARITNGTTLTAEPTPTKSDLYGVRCAG